MSSVNVRLYLNLAYYTSPPKPARANEIEGKMKNMEEIGEMNTRSDDKTLVERK